MRSILSAATHRGNRPYQEDRFYHSINENGILLAVFDGHGGDSVSEFCQKHILDAFNAVADNPALPFINNKLWGIFDFLAVRTNKMKDGSTATIAFIPSTLDRVYVGILGDSPAIVKQADGTIWVGPDHNVRSNANEAILAKARGGTIYGGYLYAQGLAAHGLQMSRVLGDADMGSVVSREPEIFELPLGPGSFVLLATDGILDPSHNSSEDEMRNWATPLGDKLDITADRLVQNAVKHPTYDNATCLLLRITT